MTCVLGMIVNREREIRNFHVTNFYRIAGLLNIEGETVECEWKVNENSKYFQSPKLYSEYGFLKEQDAIELINCLNAEMRISNVTKTIEKRMLRYYLTWQNYKENVQKISFISG